jgi:hypothetical protein
MCRIICGKLQNTDEIKKRLIKWSDTLYPQFGELNSVQMSFLSKSAYKFNTTSIRKMAGFLIEVD